MKSILLVLILFNIEVFAANRLLKKQNIIDIGHNQESQEIEVPKEKIAKEPNIRVVDNKTVYAKRIQSDKYDCETDFLGTETCPQQQAVCPSTTDYTDGYSVAHHVRKQYLKICSPWDVQEGGKCYLDKNNDGVKDSAHFIRSGGYVWSGYHLYSSRNISRSNTITIKPYGYIKARHYSPQACDDDNNHVVMKVNGVTKLDTWCGRSRDTGYIELFKNSTPSTVRANYYLFDGHAGGGWDNSYMLLYSYNLDMDIPAGYTVENNGGSVSFFKSPFCPNGTVEQNDGTCLMEYNWYSYLCPTDTNEYGEPWRVVNGGSDCGDASCANSATPPINNCARVHYTCPTDPNMKCGKTQNTIGFCRDGYVWNNNRCERIESFCGSSFYNATLDICQDITRYTKLCKEQGEVYDKVKNKCVSSVVACENGVYSETYGKCMMDFVADCNSSGYIYNPVSDICENKTQPLCKTQYNFDSSRSICVGEMAVCSTGYTYNADTNKCEKELCGVLDTDDNGTKCVTQPLCDGTLTSTGLCVPSVVK